jgi:excisionase family DNA binding protein
VTPPFAILGCMSNQLIARDGRTLLSVTDVARLANVSRDTIYREIGRGTLPAKHVGRQLRIAPRDLVKYLDREDTWT